MTTPKPHSTGELGQINARIQGFIDYLLGSEENLAGRVTPEQFSVLLADITQAGDLISRSSADCAPVDIARYRENLQQLCLRLPQLETQLRIEHSRIRLEQEHLAAAGNWATASREIGPHFK